MKIASNMYAVIFLLSLCVVTTQAQHLSSTKAGYLNMSEGEVSILSENNNDSVKAKSGKRMRNGDFLKTGRDGYAELLLNPGSYLRVDVFSEIEAIETDLTDISFSVSKGSISIEAENINKRAPIEIRTPHGSITIPKSGLYRIDVDEDGTLVSVRKGELTFNERNENGDNKTYKLKSWKSAWLSESDPPLIAEINKDSADDFDTWCFDRADRIMAANQYLVRRSSNILASGWWYDPYYGYHTYIPYNDVYWSPYGFGFFNSRVICNQYYYHPFPRRWYRQPRIIIGFEYHHVRNVYRNYPRRNRDDYRDWDNNRFDRDRDHERYNRPQRSAWRFGDNTNRPNPASRPEPRVNDRPNPPRTIWRRNNDDRSNPAARPEPRVNDRPNPTAQPEPRKTERPAPARTIWRRDNDRPERSPRPEVRDNERPARPAPSERREPERRANDRPAPPTRPEPRNEDKPRPEWRRDNDRPSPPPRSESRESERPARPSPPERREPERRDNDRPAPPPRSESRPSESRSAEKPNPPSSPPAKSNDSPSKSGENSRWRRG